MSDLERLIELVRTVADDVEERRQGRLVKNRRHPTLFDPPAQSHSPTSRAAAAAIKPSRQRMSDRVFAWISLHPGCTDEQIAAGLEMNPSSARPRRVELSRRGEIVMAGEALTASGRRAATWKAKNAPQDRP